MFACTNILAVCVELLNVADDVICMMKKFDIGSSSNEHIKYEQQHSVRGASDAARAVMGKCMELIIHQGQIKFHVLMSN